jgi:hypothetical protein
MSHGQASGAGRAPHRRPAAGQPDFNMSKEVVERVLVEKTQRLENQVKQLESALRAAEAVTLEATLGPLRLRQAILLYVGTGTADEFWRERAADMGVDVATVASQHPFILNNVPLPDANRDALRAVFSNDASPW